jgi:hypothetical protein
VGVVGLSLEPAGYAVELGAGLFVGEDQLLAEQDGLGLVPCGAGLFERGYCLHIILFLTITLLFLRWQFLKGD